MLYQLIVFAIISLQIAFYGSKEYFHH